MCNAPAACCGGTRSDAGGLLGAVIAILFASQSGEQTRECAERIAEAARTNVNELADTLQAEMPS